MKKRELFTGHKWFILGMAVICVFILGITGHDAHFESLGKSVSFFDRCYFTLQLFALESNDAAMNWRLQFARFLAPLLTVSTAAMGLAALFGEKLRLFKLCFLRGHVVVCGAGRKGVQLVSEFRTDHRVVVIESDPTSSEIATCRDFGATVITGDATEDSVLDRAGVHHAAYLFTVCDNDGVNVEVAVKAYQKIRKDPARLPRILKCYVHIIDLRLCALFKQHKIFTETRDQFDARVFNVYENSARMLQKKYPMDRGGIGPKDMRTVHLIVVGFGRMGESIVIQAARYGHYANGKSIHITVIDQSARKKEKNFISRYPQFYGACTCEFIESDIDDPDTIQNIRNWMEDSRFLTTVVIKLDRDSFSLSCALSLCNDQLRHDKTDVPILVGMIEETGLTTLLKDSDDGSWGSGIRPFGLLDKSCSRKTILNEDLDGLARAIHEDYLNACVKAGESLGDRPALREWKDLGHAYQNENRRQADHIEIKLRALGAQAVSTAETREQDFDFSDEEIECLSRMEHQRWCAGIYLSGNDTSFLMPWESLPEHIRQRNRDTVGKIPEILKRQGLTIVRSGKKA